MRCGSILGLVERQLVEGATLDELRAVVSDLRALSRESHLADLVERRLRAIEAGGAPYTDGRPQSRSARRDRA